MLVQMKFIEILEEIHVKQDNPTFFSDLFKLIKKYFNKKIILSKIKLIYCKPNEIPIIEEVSSSMKILYNTKQDWLNNKKHKNPSSYQISKNQQVVKYKSSNHSYKFSIPTLIIPKQFSSIIDNLSDFSQESNDGVVCIPKNKNSMFVDVQFAKNFRTIVFNNLERLTRAYFILKIDSDDKCTYFYDKNRIIMKRLSIYPGDEFIFRYSKYSSPFRFEIR